MDDSKLVAKGIFTHTVHHSFQKMFLGLKLSLC